MGRNISRVIMATIALLLVAVASVPAEAQYSRRSRGRGYTKAQVEQIIRRLENQSDRFVRSFDRSLDNSRADGTMREDNLNQRARDLENALDILRQEEKVGDDSHSRHALLILKPARNRRLQGRSPAPRPDSQSLVTSIPCPKSL